MTSWFLPARLLDAGQLALVRLFTEANSADAEEAEVSAVSPTQAAAVVFPHLEFGLPLLFND